MVPLLQLVHLVRRITKNQVAWEWKIIGILFYYFARHNTALNILLLDVAFPTSIFGMFRYNNCIILKIFS